MVARPVFLRICLLAAVAVAVAACDTSFDLNYTGRVDGGDAGPSVTDASTSDAPADATYDDALQVEDAVVADGDPQGTGGFCGCDMTQGIGCCIPPRRGPAYCTPSGDACTSTGGVFVLCTASTSDSACCWSGSVGPGAQAAAAGTCGTRPTACESSSDCPGQPCSFATCGGIRIGACGTSAPSCP